ncbi:MAG: UvrB/UvrC motif-containing protein, partial [bacterium]|nr:UvrB/UvrC motif-containing protein [bacterium]
AQSLSFQKTDSVLEAIILEAELIKKHQPYYNTKEKDDKSFNCVVITDEDFPRVLLVRKKDIDFLKLKTLNLKLKVVYGPFPNGSHLREALKIIRKIFPYRDSKCIPATLPRVQDTAGKESVTPSKNTSRDAEFFDRAKSAGKIRACFNRQIGLCPGVCTGEISKAEYARTIRNIRLLFSGKKFKILKNLEREMARAAKARNFERAQEIKKTLFALQHIQDVSLIKTRPNVSEYVRYGRAPNYRIEAYDVAHISGTDVVGSMVVVEDGLAKKSDYRKFKIRGGFGNNDLASLKEVIERRLAHSEWTLPVLFVADGGLGQKRIFEEALNARSLSIPVVAVTKNERHRPERILGEQSIIQKHKQAILLANSEAHRFALDFHRSRRSVLFRTS